MRATALLGRLRQPSSWGEFASFLVQRSGRVFLIKIAGVVVGFAVNVLVARLIGASEYGAYVYALAWVTLLSVLGRAGFDKAITRFVSTYRAQEAWPMLLGVLRASVLGVALLSLVIGTVASVVATGFIDLRDGLVATVLVGFLVLLPLQSLNMLRTGAIRGLKQMGIAEAIDGPGSMFLFGLLVAVVYLAWPTGAAFTAPYVMACKVVAVLAAFVFGSLWLTRVSPPEIRGVTARYELGEWIRAAVPFTLISGLYLVLSKTDIIMIGALLEIENAAFYTVATRIVGLVAFGTQAVNTTLMPLIAELYVTDRPAELQRLVTLAARLGVGVALAAALGLVLFGELLLAAFGPGFTAAYPAVLVLLVGQVVSSLCGPVTIMTTMTNHQNVAVRSFAVAAAANLVLNAALIPRLGLVGAALATSIALTLQNLILLTYCRTRLLVDTTALGLMRVSRT